MMFPVQETWQRYLFSMHFNCPLNSGYYLLVYRYQQSLIDFDKLVTLVQVNTGFLFFENYIVQLVWSIIYKFI